ncbi:MAG: glycosyltransferase, partial [Pseudomonadota bacterium]
AIARFSARHISYFFVHSPQEVDAYADYLGVAKDRVVFVPLQRAAPKIPRVEDTVDPYILAMGSAHRDYASLIDAVAPLGLRLLIVTRQDIIETLPKRDGVEFLHSLSQQECLELLAKARLSVTPLSNMQTASGQITFINAMQMGVAVIATRSPGTAGYVEDGATGVLVEAGDVDGLRQAITRLWQDDAARAELVERAQRFALEQLSDEAAADTLRRYLVGFLP